MALWHSVSENSKSDHIWIYSLARRAACCVLYIQEIVKKNGMNSWKEKDFVIFFIDSNNNNNLNFRLQDSF